MDSQYERPDGVHDVDGESQARTVAFIDRRHDCYTPTVQCPQRYLRDRMGEERLVKRRGDNHWRAATNRLSHDGKGEVIGYAAGELVERIKTARRKQYDATWRSGTNNRVEIALDDFH